MSEHKLFHGFVRVQPGGFVALPDSIRERYRLDEPGAQIEVVERTDGVLEFRPAISIPVNEAWFWDTRWQEGEREVDALVAAQQLSVTDGVHEFLSGLPARG